MRGVARGFGRVGLPASVGLAVAVLLLLAGLAPMIALLGGAAAATIVAAFELVADPADAKVLAERGAPGGVLMLSAIDALGAFDHPAIILDRRTLALHVNVAARQAFPGIENGIALRQWFRNSELTEAFGRMTAGEPQTHALYVEKRPVERVFRVQIVRISGHPDLFLAVFLDQSEMRRVERMRADFIANASHELRTPLATVTGFLETLQGPARDDPVNRERFITMMLDQTGRMARLIDDLLSLSRLEAQSMPQRLEPVELVGKVCGIAATLTPLAEQTGVTIDIGEPPGPLVVSAAPDELSQVIQNLIENACKYGQDGGRIEIEFMVNDSNGEVGFSVRDYGMGIAPEHIPRLTERFYRVNAEVSRERKGTGLGLAIVKHILTRHRARLSIQSRLGEGSTFSVWLPRCGETSAADK